MSNPMVHAFFVGRALASAVSEQAERVMTDALSHLGKFDAEQREALRRFADDVIDDNSKSICVRPRSLVQRLRLLLKNTFL